MFFFYSLYFIYKIIFFLLIVLFYSLLVNSFFGFKIPEKREWCTYFSIYMYTLCIIQVSTKKKKKSIDERQTERGRKRLSNSKNVKKSKSKFSTKIAALDIFSTKSRSLQLEGAFCCCFLFSFAATMIHIKCKLQTFKLS